MTWNPLASHPRCPLVVAVCLFLLMAAQPARATDYYVSATGHDNNAGTSVQAAWQTIQRVNNHEFLPGDRILFEGGRTFSGNLYFDAADAGRADAPVMVGSYGAERATIYAGTGTGIFVYNAAGFRIEGLYVVGSGRDTNTGHGIFFYNELPGDVRLDYVRITGVDSVRFGNYGVLIGGYLGGSGFRNVRITSVVAAENRLGGIFTYAAQPNVHEGVYVGYSSAYLNSGQRGLLYNSGNGITLSGVNGGTIEHSVARENGWLSDAGNGPIGIWAYDSTRILIQFNESHHNRTGGTKDGGGFCFDQNTSHSVMQFNYSHDNAGAGYLLAHKPDNYVHTNNVIRYNISENDARMNAYAGIHTWGRIRNTEVHNNTIYLAARGTATEIPRGIYVKNSSITLQDPERLHFRNNIVQTTGGVRLVEIQASALDAAIDLRFEGNAYYTTGGTFRIVWGSTIYGSLDAWRTATGQERLGGRNTGMVVDPRHLAPARGMTFDDTAMLTGLYGYRLRADSPLIDAGLDLPALGVDPGLRDYYGQAIPHDAGPLDIGAHEYSGDCHWSVSPASATAPAAGSTAGSVAVSTAHTPCGWAAQSTVPWMGVWRNAAGNAGGSADYWVTRNTTGATRSGTIRIADQVFSLSQPPDGTSVPNAPPTVSISSPAPNASFTAPATIGVTATAGDTDGSVTRVDFHAGTTLLGSDTTAPYGVSWSSVAAGTYTLTARATDSGGAQTTSAPVTITVTSGSTSLPAPWTTQDIGAVGPAGAATASGGTFTLEGGGADVWGSADALHYTWQRVSGDVTIVARVASVEYVHAWTKAGVMIREQLTAGAAHGMMLVSPGKGLAFQRRASAGGLSTSTSGGAGTAPVWVKLERRGNVITAFRSADGVSWTTVGSQTFTMGAEVYAGLAVSSHDTSQLATASFDNVAVTTASTTPPPPALPSPWQSQDVGAVGPAGSASASAGTFTVKGAGADIWGTADAFHIAWQRLSGDGDIVARVASVQNVHAWVKAGVMIRGSLTPDAAHALMLVSPGKGLAFQRRPAAGGLSSSTSGGTGTAPAWVKLERRAGTISAYRSADGITWTFVGRDTFTMGTDVYAGLVVSSHDTTRLATATFDAVSVTAR